MLKLIVSTCFLGVCCVCIAHSAAGQTVPSSPLQVRGSLSITSSIQERATIVRLSSCVRERLSWSYEDRGER
jgi:hypothetical protein